MTLNGIMAAVCAISEVTDLLISKDRPKWHGVFWLAFAKKIVNYSRSRYLTCSLLFLETMAVVLWSGCRFWWE